VIEKSGRIVEHNGHTSWIEVEHDSGCAGCDVEHQCGVAILGQGLGKRKTIVSAENLEREQIGEKVTVLIEKKKLVLVSFYAYIVPLILMMMFGVLAQHILQLTEFFYHHVCPHRICVRLCFLVFLQ
jgi:positive regulator of sigma E activity